MLALLAGTVFFAWAGNTRLICVFSAALLLYLLYQSQLYRQSFDGGQGGERIRPLAQSAILVAIAGFAKLIGDISIHFAAGAPRGLFDTASFVSSLRTFHWLGEFTIGLVFLPLAFVVFRWRIPVRCSGRSRTCCGPAGFSRSPAMPTFWRWAGGAVRPFTPRWKFFTSPSKHSLWRNDLIITNSFWNASHQDAFCLLYNIQGKRWFYALVFMIPMLCLINVLWRLAMRIPTKADKSLLFSAYLLLVAYSVANRVGDIRQSPDCYVVDRRFTATHLDHNLAMCLKSHAGDSAAACYVGASPAGTDRDRRSTASSPRA